jgi:phospholipid/cholesterol/gamma-HCH transport system substrate-binding protein
METRANFGLIVAFTLTVVIAGFGFGDWIGSSKQKVNYKIFRLVFPGSMTGLSRGSAVLFNGMPVGEVIQLNVPDEDPSLVAALIAIDQKTPIKVDTKARLEQRSLVGASVVSLVGGRPDAPEIKVQPNQRYPLIAVEKSANQQMLESFQRLSVLAPKVFDKLGKLYEEGSGAIAAATWTIEPLSKAMSDDSQEIKDFINNAKELDQSLKPIGKHFDSLLAAINSMTPQGIVGSGSQGWAPFVDIFSSSNLRQYERFATGAHKALIEFDRKAQSLERDPQTLILGVTPADPEKRGR